MAETHRPRRHQQPHPPGLPRRQRNRKTAEEYAQEYECQFTTTERSTFRPEAIYRAFRKDIAPFNPNQRWLENFAGLPCRPTYFIGADLGKKQDHSAIALIEYRTIPTGTFFEPTAASRSSEENSTSAT